MPSDDIDSVADAPLCLGCGLVSHHVHDDTPLCPDCWHRRNLWQHQGQYRYVTSDGECKHETPLCPALDGRRNGHDPRVPDSLQAAH